MNVASINPKKEDTIKLIQPKPYDEVGAIFVLSGWVPKTWLKTDYGRMDYRLFLDFLDIEAQTFMGTSVDVQLDWLSKFRNKLKFNTVVQFNQFNAGFISKSQGRIVIKLSGQKEDIQSIYIPLIVKELEPESGVDDEILNKHGKIGDIVTQYKEDLKHYYKELAEIAKSREAKDNIYENKKSNTYSYIQDWNITGGILDIFEHAEDSFSEYLYSDEDKRESELEEKYKDALRWRGPLLKGLVGSINGFELRVHSNDHGKHFHVIHKGRGVNARFTFPEIKLLSYKNSVNTIGNKEVDKIFTFFQNTENFNKLEAEFQKRSQ